MLKGIGLKSAILSSILLLSGCGGGGGGVAGGLLDNDDSTTPPVNTNTSINDLNTTAQDQLLLAKQLDLTADIYDAAINEINTLNTSFSRVLVLKKALASKQDLLDELNILKTKYKTASSNILSSYDLSDYYTAYGSSNLDDVIVAETTSLKNQISSSSDIVSVLKQLSELEESNLKYIEQYKDVLTSTNTNISYDTFIADSKSNFETFVSEIYDNGSTYVPQVLDAETFNNLVITELGIYADTTADNFNVVNTFDENNITKVQVTKSGTKLLYLNDDDIKNNLYYISKQEELSNQLFSQFKDYTSLSSLSSTLTTLYNAELTHFNNGSNLLVDEYGLLDGFNNYSSTSLESTYSEFNSSTPSTSNLKDALTALIKLEERSIYDLTDSIAKNTTHPDINELYEKLKIASENHLKYLVKQLYTSGFSYYPQILDSNTYTSIIGTMLGSNTSTNITIDNIYDENNITKVLVTKTNVNSFALSSNVEKESLLYIAKQEEMTSDLFLILKSFSSAPSIVSVLSEAEYTHFNAAEDMLGFYNLTNEYSGYTNDGLDNFQSQITQSTTSTSSAINILKALMMVEERSIKYLNDHIANNASGNDDLVNLYNSFLTASKNHLKLLAEILFDPDGYNTTYSPSILSSSEYSDIVGTLGNSVVEVIDSSKPNITFYSTYGDNNVTSISILEEDVSNAPYSANDNEADKNDLAYISQLEKISAEVFNSFVSVVSDIASTYTVNNSNIKDLLSSMNNAEATHYNTMNSMLTIYGTSIATDSNLDNFKAQRISSPTAITNETTYIEMLNSLAFMEERSICDLNRKLEDGINLSEIKELFTRLEDASINHLRILINSINEAQGNYTYQLITDTTTCGTGLESKLDNIIAGSTDENIDVYLYVASNGISDVSISQKPFGGEIETGSIAEDNSLRYFDYFMNQLQVATTTMYAKLNTPANFTPIDQIIYAQSSHVSSMNDAIAVYNVATPISDVDRSSVDDFYNAQVSKNITDANNTKEDQNILNVIGLIEERKILDLEDHITNTVNQNTNIVNIYKGLQNAAKNHLLIIDKIYTEQFGLPYSPQLLEESIHSTFLPYADETSFIKGTPVSN